MVEWSDPAKQDLKLIHDYIAKDSKFYAKKVSLEILEKSEKINIFPEIGRIVPEIGDPKIRELLGATSHNTLQKTNVQTLWASFPPTIVKQKFANKNLPAC